MSVSVGYIHDRTLRIINALSKANLGSIMNYSIIQNALNEMSPESKRIISLSATLTDWAPFFRYFKRFLQLSDIEKKKWLSSIKPGSLIDVIVNDLLMFMTAALFFVDENNAKAINYDRSPLKSPTIITHVPKLSSVSKPKNMYDVVIIGSGAGGAVVAWELARRGG